MSRQPVSRIITESVEFSVAGSPWRVHRWCVIKSITFPFDIDSACAVAEREAERNLVLRETEVLIRWTRAFARPRRKRMNNSLPTN